MTIAICIGVVLFLFLSNMPVIFRYLGRFIDFFRSITLGIVFAYLLNPLVRLFEYHLLKDKWKPKTRHMVSVIITFLVTGVLWFLLGFFLIPQIVSSVGVFIGNLEDYMSSAKEALERVTEFFAGHDLDISGFITNVEEVFSGIQDKLPSSINGILSLLGNARALRKNMTPHERKLWFLFLRTYPVRIYRQRIIDHYIVDFFCSAAKLVIEIDGTQHYETEGSAKDRERDRALESLGLKVIRVSNREIDREFASVCAYIDREIQTRM